MTSLFSAVEKSPTLLGHTDGYSHALHNRKFQNSGVKIQLHCDETIKKLLP